MTVGQRIKASRRACCLSLRDLAARIDHRVTAQAISKYERDESIPSSGVLIALADALGVPVDYLASGSDLRFEAVSFRKRPAAQKEKAQVEANVLHLLERYLTVEEILGLPTVAQDMPREAPWPVLRNLAEAEHAALGLRVHWGLGSDPIPNFVDLLEERGIKVLAMSFLDIDGLAVRVRRETGSVVPVMVVNRDDWGERQRFTLACELGHMALDITPQVDREKAAERFARAFLMPAEALRAEIGKHRRSMGWGELFDLKRIFGVSVQALTHRCRDLEIFNPPLVRLLFNEFSSRGWCVPPYKEPGAMPGEQPMRFERLCFRALAEDAISEAKAAELLGCSVHELNRWMDEPPEVEVALAKA